MRSTPICSRSPMPTASSMKQATNFSRNRSLGSLSPRSVPVHVRWFLYT
jgi:hypothetical protein